MKVYFNLTNLMDVPFITGIQRVAIEVVKRMLKSDVTVDMIYYNKMVDRFFYLNNQAFTNFYDNKQGKKEDIKTSKEFFLDEIEPFAIYYDIDAVWNNLPPISYLYKKLKRKGARIVTFVHDVIPLKFPQYAHENTRFNFMTYFSAVLKNADLILVNTETTKKDILELATSIGIEINVEVTPLASDFEKEELTGTPSPKYVDIIKKMGKYILAVGTVEPRKNYDYLVDLLDIDGFKDLDLKIIIVGRIGWHSEDFEKRIKIHPERGKTLFHFDDIDDPTLAYIYENAYALAFPSFYEGFGLPIVEALSAGLPVLASDISVLREVGGNHARYFSLDNPHALYEILQEFHQNPKRYQKMKDDLKKFKPILWNDTVNKMHQELIKLDDYKEYGDISITQAVALTARPKVCVQTLEYIENLMTFIKEIVIVTPEKMISEIKSLYKGNISLVFISDEDIAGRNEIPRDHATRNFFLRARSFVREEVDDYFVVYDDDARPLTSITQDVFVKNNKINAHYFYELDEWKVSYPEASSFDIGSIKTKDLLDKWGCPKMQYCSHMPQVMSKAIWMEILLLIPDLDNAGLVEWTLFYNYAIKHHPYLINPVKYKALSWPALPSDWEEKIYPEEYLFENYYDFLYEKGQIFEGFSHEYNKDILKEAAQKIKIRKKLTDDEKNFKVAKKAYERKYQDDFGETPSFILAVNKEDVRWRVPKYLVLNRSEGDILTLEIEHFKIVREVEHISVNFSFEYSVYDAGRGFKRISHNTFEYSDKIHDRNEFEFHFGVPPYNGNFILEITLRLGGKKLGTQIPMIVS